jgi:hypothetical protein
MSSIMSAGVAPDVAPQQDAAVAQGGAAVLAVTHAMAQAGAAVEDGAQPVARRAALADARPRAPEVVHAARTAVWAHARLARRRAAPV